LRASRERLVLAADADRRAIERDLHGGVQQHLVALTVNMQLAGRLLATDPPAAQALLEAMQRDVQQALDEAAQLAQRIYPPLLEARGLGALLRSVAASAPVPVRIEATASASCPPEVAVAVYFCVLELLDNATTGARLTVKVREEEGALVFEVIKDEPRSAVTATRSDSEFDRLRDRVEALGGQLTVLSEPGGGTRVSGSLPFSR
jgi:signal transduction histidine kinase